jgi:hypothetical protein
VPSTLRNIAKLLSTSSNFTNSATAASTS